MARFRETTSLSRVKNLDEYGVQTRDSEIAAEIYKFLTGKGLSVFLSTLTLEQLGHSAYTRAIDSALESATVLLAIGTSVDHLNSGWVQYEWDSFSNAIRSGTKPNGRVFTYIEGMAITALPWALRQTQTFVHSRASLERLYNFINNALEREDKKQLGQEPRSPPLSSVAPVAAVSSNPPPVVTSHVEEKPRTALERATMKYDFATRHYHIRPGDSYISDKDHKLHRWRDTSGSQNPTNEDVYKGASITIHQRRKHHYSQPHCSH